MKSGRFQARFTAPKGKRFTAPQTFADKLSAFAWLAETRKSIDLGTWVAPLPYGEPTVPTVFEIVDLCLTHVSIDLRQTSKATYTGIVDNRFNNYPPFQRMLVSELETGDVAKWRHWIITRFPHTPDRNKRAYSKLRAAVATAVEMGFLPINPVQLKAARKQAPRKKTLPTGETLHSILEHTPENYRFAVCMCLFHGIRVGECLALKPTHVIADGARLTIKIEGTLCRVSVDGKVTMVYQPPKTEAGYREVPVLKEFAPLVFAQLKAQKGCDELTTTGTGQPVMDTSFRSIFHRAKAKAGAPSEITPHYGRNWLITQLAEAGATCDSTSSKFEQTNSPLAATVSRRQQIHQSRPIQFQLRYTLGCERQAYRM